VSRYQKGKTSKVKTNLDLLEKEIVSGRVASAGLYASLHLIPDNHANIPPTIQFFTGRMPFLLPNKQRQSTEGKSTEGMSTEGKKMQEKHCIYFNFVH